MICWEEGEENYSRVVRVKHGMLFPSPAGYYYGIAGTVQSMVQHLCVFLGVFITRIIFTLNVFSCFL